MPLLDYAGYAAALKVWRTRATKDISLKMFLVLVTGLALWFSYGLHKGEMPLILANGATL